MRRRALAVPLAIAVLAASSCGGGGAPEAATPVSEPAVEPATTEAEPPTETASAETDTTRAPVTDAEPPEAGESAAAKTKAPAPKAPPGLPRYTAGYEDWARLDASPIPPRDGDPHLGTKHVYASVEPGAGGVYPDGAVIVKDITRPDADFVGVVAVMRKVAGSDPSGGDWKFVEYERPSPGARFTVLAEGQICTSCHMGAAETDYVWIASLGLIR